MLVLTRRPGEEILINGDIRITVVGIGSNKVRIGITAPEHVTVDRKEVSERRAQVPVDLEPAPRETPGAEAPVSPKRLRNVLVVHHESPGHSQQPAHCFSDTGKGASPQST